MGLHKIQDFNHHLINESHIIRRILAGEKELYEILLRRNNQKLYRVIRSYINDHAEIEDVMQNTYLKAYDKLDQFKQTATYSTWLIRIGINEALARLKEKSKFNRLHSASTLVDDHTILEMPDTNQLNPEKKIMHQEAKQLLEATIDSLETTYRTIYVLKEVEEISIKEIAEILNISISNAKVRIHRAKQMIKEKLYEQAIDKNIFEFGFSRCDRVSDQVMSVISLT
ncbi:RNA polymerase sigma factor [Reichenbachiella sp.]|uniref:RNA polymerase sigma factor n=1 Tax=Reichenbachiella sp. TaxID=2184521 RepID=UPI003BAF5162